MAILSNIFGPAESDDDASAQSTSAPLAADGDGAGDGQIDGVSEQPQGVDSVSDQPQTSTESGGPAYEDIG